MPISRFYLLDAASPNTGTMPSGASASPAWTLGTPTSGDATGAEIVRDATDTPGISNPDLESSITSAANLNAQRWGHRRFVSRPLANQILPAAGNWTFSYSRSESSLNHHQGIVCSIYAWRPTMGLKVGSSSDRPTGTEPTIAATEQAESVSAATNNLAGLAIQDEDILVFDIASSFTQDMATSYTEQFAYDGTTDADTVSCASFVDPPAALLLLGDPPPPPPPSIATLPVALWTPGL
jgi:hypothetical protein